MILREGGEVACIVQCVKERTCDPRLGISSTSKPSAIYDGILLSVCALVVVQNFIAFVKLKVG